MEVSVLEIHVQQLEVFARVGVTEDERSRPQRLTLDITVWPRATMAQMNDDILQTVNYSDLASEARNVVDERTDKLVETLADCIAARLMDVFSIRQVRVELHKFVLPGTDYVSVTVTRGALV